MGKGNANAGFVMTHEGASENLYFPYPFLWPIKLML